MKLPQPVRSCLGQRHKMVVTGHRVHQASRGNGTALPKFVIYERRTCSKCGDEDYKQRGSVHAHDGREAAQLSGLPEADWPAVPAASKSKPVEARLSSWPFPSSAHKEATP